MREQSWSGGGLPALGAAGQNESGSNAKWREGRGRTGFLLAFVLLTVGLITRADDAAPAQFNGTVVDEAGRPVVDATVDCYHFQRPSRMMFFFKLTEPEFTQQTRTDNKGAFAVTATPGTTFVVVKKTGLAPAWKTWPSDGDDLTAPLVLTGPKTLSGVVVDENDRPVPEAEVWVSEATETAESGSSQQNEISGRLARECFSAHTAADGRFRIENFPNDGLAALSVTKAGMAQRPTPGHFIGSQEYHSGQNGIRLKLGLSGGLEGKVIVQEIGQPVTAAKVWLMASTGDGGRHGPVISGADGTFQFQDLEPATYNVLSAMPGQPLPQWATVPEYRLASVRAGETNREVVIHATAGVMVEVSVVTTNDLRPLAHVMVCAGNLTAYTGNDGVARLRLAPGTNWFFATKTDWSQQHAIAGLVPGLTNQVRIEMVPPPHITGMVRGPDGAPARGVLVSFHPGYYPATPLYNETHTDENGHYELVMRQYSKEFSSWAGWTYPTNFVMVQDLKRNFAAIKEFGGAATFGRESGALPTNLDFNLQPGITLTGSVIDDHGAPVTSAMINAQIMTGRTFYPVLEKPIKVDDHGCFSLPALPQGREYHFFNLTAKGYGSAYGGVESMDTKTNHYEFSKFVLKKADRILAGQVVGADGKPAPEIPINFSGPGQRQNFTGTIFKSDENGRFVFEGVSEGSVTVTVNSGSNSGNVSAHGGDTNVVLRLGIIQVQDRPYLTPPITTTGTVRDPAGALVAGAMVSLNVPPTITVQSDTRGRYEFIWQARLTYDETHWLLARDLQHGLAATCELDPQTTNLDLKLQAGITLSMPVSDTDGKRLTNATAKVTLWHGNRGYATDPQPVTADDRGRISIPGLPQGQKYSVSVTAPGHNSAQLHAEAGETKTNFLELPPSILVPTDCDVAGQVLDETGKPVAGLEVQISARGTDTPRTYTDADGHFEYHNVSRGEVCFYAGQPIANTSALSHSGKASGHGGDTNVVVRVNLH